MKKRLSATLVLPSHPMTDYRMQRYAFFGMGLCFLGALADLPTIICDDAAPSFYCSRSSRATFHIGSLLMVGMGGALIGAGFTQLAANRKTQDLLDEVADTLSRTVAAPALFSTEPSIAHLRRSFWSYHATQRDGQTVWRVAHLDFQKTPAVNRLFSQLEHINLDGTPDFRYQVEAFVRDNLLILLQKADIGAEPTGLRVFPSGGAGFNDRFSGVAFHTNFDEKPSINKTILTKDPILDLAKPEVIDDPIKVAELDAEWRKGFRTFDIHVG